MIAAWPPRLAARLLAGEILALPLVAMFVPQGVSALLAIGFLGLALDAGVRRNLAGPRALTHLWPLAGLIALGALSALWSTDPAQSLSVAARLALLFAAFLTHAAAAVSLSPEERRFLLRCLAFAAVLHLGLALLGGGPGSPLVWLVHQISPKNLDDDKVHFNRGLAALAVLTCAYLGAWLRVKGPLWALGLAVAILLLLGLAVSRSAPLALALALVVALAVWRWRGVGVAGVYAALLLALFLLPLALDRFYDTQTWQDMQIRYMSWNVKHRLIIWQFALERLAEHPWLGWGLDASRNLPGGSRNIPNVEGAEFMPLHPHNGFIQVWLELGFAGVLVLAAAFIAMARQQIARFKERAVWMGLAAGATFSYVLQGMLSYGVWQGWWLSLAVLSAAFFMIAAGEEEASAPAP